MNRRRAVMQQSAALSITVLLGDALGLAHASVAEPDRFLSTVPAATADALRRFAQGGSIRLDDNLVKLDIASLVENGHAVPVTLSLNSGAKSGAISGAKSGAISGTARATALALFTEENPQPEVARFDVSSSPRSQVSCRMRIAKSQRIWALARMSDGVCHARPVNVIVTLAACVEGV
jgi:sulfur-oxidizing protein SoxY